jgi:hypothetical protein
MKFKTSPLKNESLEKLLNFKNNKEYIIERKEYYIIISKYDVIHFILKDIDIVKLFDEIMGNDNIKKYTYVDGCVDSRFVENTNILNNEFKKLELSKTYKDFEISFTFDKYNGKIFYQVGFSDGSEIHTGRYRFDMSLDKMEYLPPFIKRFKLNDDEFEEIILNDI